MNAFDGTAERKDCWVPAPSEQYQREHPGWNRKLDEPLPGLAKYLSVQAWMDRSIPEPDRLLGDVLTTTSRMFLIGRTGLGKTQMGFAIGCGMASGEGFLHWRCARPARVLVIDGEMPSELIKARSIDAVRRGGKPPIPGNLIIFNRDLEDEIAKLFPSVGPILPLNTEAGQKWLLALIDALGGVDVVIFDNVMSLVVGSQKDEVVWSETMPLIHSLTGRRIGQIWLDDTGWNTDRQYGSSTKPWHFDAAGVMTALPADQRAPHEVAFTLSFDDPGKCRRRTPLNWADFETCIIRLKDDRWTSEPVNKAPTGHKLDHVPPSREPFYDAVVSAIVKSDLGPGRTTLETWEAECVRRGLIEPQPDAEDYKQRHSRFTLFRTAKAALLGAKWIAVEEKVVIDLKGRWA